MNAASPKTKVIREPFVDAREAAYTMNLPLYYMTNARQRTKLCIPHYRIGRMVRFKLSELADWQMAHGGVARAALDGTHIKGEVSDD